MAQSATVTRKLRQAGIMVTNQLQADKLGKQFKYADRIGARVAVVFGPDEAANQTASLKDLKTGHQQTVALADLADAIRKLLEASQAS